MAATRHLGSVPPRRVIKAVIPSITDPMTDTTSDSFSDIPTLPTLTGTHKHSLDAVKDDIISERKAVKNTNKRAKVNVNLVKNDVAASVILKQYNSLIEADNFWSVQYTSPIQVPNVSKMNKKAKRVSKRNTVFTAGLSSISKPQRPSFAVPRESINRANLPRSVMVEQLNDQFTFGLKSRKGKAKFDEMNIPKFKQMRVFGLDSFPTIDLEQYLSNALMQTGIRGNTKVKVGYGKKNYPRRLEPIKHNSADGGISRNFFMESKFPKGRDGYTSGEEEISTPRSDGRFNFVSFNNPGTNNDEYIMKRLLRNSYPSQQDWKRQQYLYRKSKIEARDTTVSGICSLAPIQMGNNDLLSNSSPYMREHDKSRRSRHTSVDGDTVFESDLESLLNTTGYKIKQASTRNASAVSHASNASQSARLNPPPSSSSSTADEEDMPLPSFPKIMIPLHEEFSTISLSTISRNTRHEAKSRIENQDTPSEVQQIKASTISSEEVIENVPNVYVQNMRLDLKSVEKEKDSKFEKYEKKSTSSRKGGEYYTRTPVNILFEDANNNVNSNQMMINGNVLNIPFVPINTETRPPLTDRPGQTKFEINGSKVSEISSEHVRPVSEHSIPIPRVAVQTLNPFPKPVVSLRVAATPAIDVTFDSGEKQTIQESHELQKVKYIDIGEDEKVVNSDNTQKPFVVNSKTLQFISPLQTQINAKRQ